MAHLVRKGGRPRKAGPREPSGRLSRRVSSENHQARIAQATWAAFADAAGESLTRIRLEGLLPVRRFNTEIPDHPLLRLVQLGKLENDVFLVALYWLCTDHRLAPDWPFRARLRELTGFDFTRSTGCLAARDLARQNLGTDVVDVLDAVALKGEFQADLPTLSAHFLDLWNVWTRQAQSPSKSKASLRPLALAVKGL